MAIDTLPKHGSRLIPQLMKFGAVGAVGFVVNLVVFNGLMLLVFNGVLHATIYSTIIATVVAIGTNWVGNRFWAFSAQRQSNTAREGVEFFIISLAGMGIPLFCVWLSHYVLGYVSLFADNIANNVIGLVLGTMFRFAFYRWWVFSPERAERLAAKSRTITAPSARVPSAKNPASAFREAVSTSTRPTSLSGSPDRGLVGD
ncbi:MAG: GtrA family protein [Leifsonia sp.]